MAKAFIIVCVPFANLAAAIRTSRNDIKQVSHVEKDVFEGRIQNNIRGYKVASDDFVGFSPQSHPNTGWLRPGVVPTAPIVGFPPNHVAYPIHPIAPMNNKSLEDVLRHWKKDTQTFILHEVEGELHEADKRSTEDTSLDDREENIPDQKMKQNDGEKVNTYEERDIAGPKMKRKSKTSFEADKQETVPRKKHKNSNSESFQAHDVRSVPKKIHKLKARTSSMVYGKEDIPRPKRGNKHKTTLRVDEEEEGPSPKTRQEVSQSFEANKHTDEEALLKEVLKRSLNAFDSLKEAMVTLNMKRTGLQQDFNQSREFEDKPIALAAETSDLAHQTLIHAFEAYASLKQASLNTSSLEAKERHVNGERSKRKNLTERLGAVPISSIVSTRVDQIFDWAARALKHTFEACESLKERSVGTWRLPCSARSPLQERQVEGRPSIAAAAASTSISIWRLPCFGHNAAEAEVERSPHGAALSAWAWASAWRVLCLPRSASTERLVEKETRGIALAASASPVAIWSEGEERHLVEKPPPKEALHNAVRAALRTLDHYESSKETGAEKDAGNAAAQDKAAEVKYQHAREEASGKDAYSEAVDTETMEHMTSQGKWRAETGDLDNKTESWKAPFNTLVAGVDSVIGKRVKRLNDVNAAAGGLHAIREAEVSIFNKEQDPPPQVGKLRAKGAVSEEEMEAWASKKSIPAEPDGAIVKATLKEHVKSESKETLLSDAIMEIAGPKTLRLKSRLAQAEVERDRLNAAARDLWRQILEWDEALTGALKEKPGRKANIDVNPAMDGLRAIRESEVAVATLERTALQEKAELHAKDVGPLDAIIQTWVLKTGRLQSCLTQVENENDRLAAVVETLREQILHAEEVLKSTLELKLQAEQKTSSKNETEAWKAKNTRLSAELADDILEPDKKSGDVSTTREAEGTTREADVVAASKEQTALPKDVESHDKQPKLLDALSSQVESQLVQAEGEHDRFEGVLDKPRQRIDEILSRALEMKRVWNERDRILETRSLDAEREAEVVLANIRRFAHL